MPITLGLNQQMGGGASGLLPVLSTWNPSDKAANITLSAGNLRADGDGVGWGSVRGTNARRSGKWYYEAAATSIVGGAATGVGVANNAAANSGTYFGVDTNGLTIFAMGGTFYNAGSVLATPAYVTAAVVGVAVNMNIRRLWPRINGTWYGGDPVTDSGGIDISLMFGIELFPGFSDANDGAMTANFSATPPAGYASWG